MNYDIYRNGTHIAYCEFKDIKKEWTEKTNEHDTWEIKMVE